MPIPAIDLAAISTATTSTISAKVVQGDLTSLPVGSLLSAVVTRIDSGQAQVQIGNTAITLRLPFAVAPDSALLIRIPPGTPPKTIEFLGEVFANPTGKPPTPDSIAATVRQDPSGKLVLEVGKNLIPIQSKDLLPGDQVFIRPPGKSAVQTAPSTTNPNTTTNAKSTTTPERVDTVTTSASRVPVSLTPTDTAPTTRPTVVIAEGLQPGRDGRQVVLIDGKRTLVESSEPLPLGAKTLVQIEPGIRLPIVRPIDLNTLQPAQVAEAILRDPAPRLPLGQALQTLLKSFSELPAGQQTPSTNAIRQTIAELIPSTGQPPSAEQILRFVRDGGLQYEAKLANAPEDGPAPAVASDLKGHLLRLLQTHTTSPTPEVGNSIPIVRQTLDAVEIQQAINVLAQSQGTPLQLHIPLAGSAQWLTMQLAVNPDRNPNESADGDSRRGFDLLMHVDLTNLGDTWIDARVAGNHLSAVLYVESEAGREMARAESPELKSALREAGFENVLLDIRSTAEMPEGRNAARFESLRETRPTPTTTIDERA